jgi:hypothetical protein
LAEKIFHGRQPKPNPLKFGCWQHHRHSGESPAAIVIPANAGIQLELIDG